MDEFRTEWDFDEPSHKVDISKIVYQIGTMNALQTKAYLEELRKNAPMVFGRLFEWCRVTERMPYLEELQDLKR